jgi:hypothetical protein
LRKPSGVISGTAHHSDVALAKSEHVKPVKNSAANNDRRIMAFAPYSSRAASARASSLGVFGASDFPDIAAVDPALVCADMDQISEDILDEDPMTGPIARHDAPGRRPALTPIHDEIVMRDYPADYGEAGARPFAKIDKTVGRLGRDGAPDAMMVPRASDYCGSCGAF